MRLVGPAVFCVAVLAACSEKHNEEQRTAFLTREPKTFKVSDNPPASQCPGDMVEVEGDFCPNVEERCLRWVDLRGNTVSLGFGQSAQDWDVSARCGEFKYPTRCLSTEKVHKHYCIDVYEYPNIEGERPRSWMTWYDARTALEKQGKRMCSPSEWSFACEGPEMHPYPYGDGYHRDSTSCNTDNPFHEDPNEPINPKTGKRPLLNVFHATSHKTPTATVLDQMLVTAGYKPNCVSPFGVHDLVGNIDEWVALDGKPSYLMGGHVFGVRNNCRADTTGHGPLFSWYETGTRGCMDATPGVR
jgi:formylglycine-generating enzyme